MTDTEPRWYCVSRKGLAQLCADEADARECAAENDVAWPLQAPHVATQLVPLARATRAAQAVPAGKRADAILRLVDEFAIARTNATLKHDNPHSLRYRDDTRKEIERCLRLFVREDDAAAPTPPAAAEARDADLREALEIARAYVAAHVQGLREAYRGYPHRYARDEADLAKIDAALAAHQKGGGE